MINFTNLALKEFDDHLLNVFSNDSVHIETIEILRKMALISFTQFTKSNSIYFTLGHSLSTSLVGIGIIDAIKSQVGLVRESEAINLMASILFCNILRKSSSLRRIPTYVLPSCSAVAGRGSNSVTSPAMPLQDTNNIRAATFFILLQKLFKTFDAFGGALQSTDQSIGHKLIPLVVLVDTTVNDGPSS